MKKALFCLALAFAALSPSLALDGYTVQSFHQDTDDKFVTIDMEYTEETQNLIVVYRVKYKAFDEGDAFVAVRDAVQKFANERGFLSYATYSNDVIKYRGTETTLTRFILLKK